MDEGKFRSVSPTLAAQHNISAHRLVRDHRVEVHERIDRGEGLSEDADGSWPLIHPGAHRVAHFGPRRAEHLQIHVAEFVEEHGLRHGQEAAMLDAVATPQHRHRRRVGSLHAREDLLDGGIADRVDVQLPTLAEP